MGSSLALSLCRPPLRYHGSKWRLAPWIIQHFPPHKVYVEVFGGGASVLLRKPPSKIEVYNDLDDDLVNFFRVLRSPRQCAALCEALRRTPYSRIEYDRAHVPAKGAVERARRLTIRAHLGFGSNAGTRRSRCGFRAKDWSSRQANNLAWPRVPDAIAAASARFAGVIVEASDACKLIRTKDSPTTLFYCDPPYVNATRTNQAKDHSYRHELTDEDHRQLATTLGAVVGLVVLSGYPSGLYDELYAGWPSITRASRTQGNARTQWRTEKLWLSPRAAAALHDLFTEHA